jgi:ribosomal-protein-alanine N-acetyltransferase
MQHPSASSTITLLDPGDAVAVAQCIVIDATVFPHACTQFGLRSERSCVLVAREEAGRRVVGFLAATFEGADLYVKGLAVDAEARRRGIGRSLVHAGVTEARRRQASALVLNVAVGNHAALALYESAGFVVRRRLPRFYRRGSKGHDGDAFEMALGVDPAG